MNERIKQLALQCGAWHQVYGGKRILINEYFDVEKFANLLIQDCMDVVDGYTKQRTFETHYDAVEQIKNLFEIEN